MAEPDIDTDQLDDAAVLALLSLTVHDADRFSGLARAAWQAPQDVGAKFI